MEDRGQQGLLGLTMTELRLLKMCIAMIGEEICLSAWLLAGTLTLSKLDSESEWAASPTSIHQTSLVVIPHESDGKARSGSGFGLG